VQPASDDDSQNRQPLLPVIYRDLNEEVWKVEINHGDRPALILNNEIPEIARRLKQDVLLQGLMFPAAFRIVLEAMLRDESEDDDDNVGWRADWLKFCSERLGIHEKPPLSDEEATAEWIDDAVRRLCREYGFMKSIRSIQGLKI
jgi:hypothetical protein